eukprot:GHVO01010259.1.p1 GENE.GHVO01010259.1~~GHVO01010259.1.p1  ORF type:complete len:139 (+),score=12.82 GHVO01010259.1:115-531(+)
MIHPLVRTAGIRPGTSSHIRMMSLDINTEALGAPSGYSLSRNRRAGRHAWNACSYERRGGDVSYVSLTFLLAISVCIARHMASIALLSPSPISRRMTCFITARDCLMVSTVIRGRRPPTQARIQYVPASTLLAPRTLR